MNVKDRVLAAVKLEKTDKIPSSYRGDNDLSIKLSKHFGLEDPNNVTKNHKKIIENVGADFYSSGSKIGKFSTFTPGYSGPKPVEPHIEDHQLFYQIGIKSILKRSQNNELSYEALVDPVLASIDDVNELKKGFLTDKLKYFDFNNMQNKYGDKELTHRKLLSSGRDFICIGTLTYFFTMCWFLRGFEKFLMDLAFNKKLAEAIISEVTEFGIEFNRRELASFGDTAEYYGGADDVAGQDGMLISPDLFNKYFIPAYKKLINNVKKHNIIFGWHCCGSINKVLPLMIDAGIDIFDVVQTSAKDMDLENMHKLYGKNICLHGGIDVQNLLVFGSPEEIREEVKKVKDLWGNDGGIILAPAHTTLPETPVENVLAIYEELNNM